MENDIDDQEIRDLMSGYRLKEPPKALLWDYENEVMKKIQSLESVSVIPIPIMALSAALILALAFFWLMILKPTPVYQPAASSNHSSSVIPDGQRPIRDPGLSAENRTDPSSGGDPGFRRNDSRLYSPARDNSQPREVSDEKTFDQMERELFILEMLGEDEGLIDDAGRLAADAEFVLQASPVIG